MQSVCIYNKRCYDCLLGCFLVEKNTNIDSFLGVGCEDDIRVLLEKDRIYNKIIMIGIPSIKNLKEIWFREVIAFLNQPEISTERIRIIYQPGKCISEMISNFYRYYEYNHVVRYFSYEPLYPINNFAKKYFLTFFEANIFLANTNLFNKFKEIENIDISKYIKHGISIYNEQVRIINKMLKQRWITSNEDLKIYVITAPVYIEKTAVRCFELYTDCDIAIIAKGLYSRCILCFCKNNNNKAMEFLKRVGGKKTNMLCLILSIPITDWIDKIKYM
jgi:hypothetical protein